MAAIVESIEISRRPEDVFAYLTEPSHVPEWQESALSVRADREGPLSVGSRVTVTRRAAGREWTMTNEVTEVNPPVGWALRGIDGPVRGILNGRIEPLEGGQRSRVTLSLDFEPHGIGKLLLPLVVRPQVRREMPKNLQNLKQRLETGA
jgi:uncharacterized protein YndB with AHSA1/START domain